MSVLQLFADVRMRNITEKCYNHYFHYNDVSVALDGTFNGLALADLSGLLIIYAGLLMVAVCVFIGEMVSAAKNNAISPRALVDDHTHMLKVQAANEVLKGIIVKWRIHHLIYEARGGVQSMRLN
jgi:hypothetical protein